MAPDTWNLSRPNHVIVQQYLVVYLEYFLWNEIYNTVPGVMCGEPVCYSHCLLKFYKSVALCHV